MDPQDSGQAAIEKPRVVLIWKFTSLPVSRAYYRASNNQTNAGNPVIHRKIAAGLLAYLLQHHQ